MPFSESKASAIVTKKITDGERPPRPPKGKKLGLSDELWEVVRSSLAQEVEERPLVSTFVDFLEDVTPDIAVVEELTKFDANSEEHVQELRCMFGHTDNTLLGMREEETLIVVEVFDRVDLLLPTFHLSNVSDIVWFQVLNSSLNDSALRSRCLRGLQKVSARCGFLPKSYWISHSTLAEPDGAPPAGGVSSTCQRLMDGMLVAVKTISPDCIENLDTFKRVRLSASSTNLSLMPVSVWILTEIVGQRNHVEAIAASERCLFPWVRLSRSSFLPCIPLDVQREFV